MQYYAIRASKMVIRLKFNMICTNQSYDSYTSKNILLMRADRNMTGAATVWVHKTFFR